MMDGKHQIDYESYIRSSEWQEKRQERLRIDGFTCKACGTNKDLQVHHLTYDRLSKENMDDLITLCADCHKKEHNYRELYNLTHKINTVVNYKLNQLAHDIRKITAEYIVNREGDTALGKYNIANNKELAKFGEAVDGYLKSQEFKIQLSNFNYPLFSKFEVTKLRSEHRARKTKELLDNGYTCTMIAKELGISYQKAKIAIDRINGTNPKKQSKAPPIPKLEFSYISGREVQIIDD